MFSVSPKLYDWVSKIHDREALLEYAAYFGECAVVSVQAGNADQAGARACLAWHIAQLVPSLLSQAAIADEAQTQAQYAGGMQQ